MKVKRIKKHGFRQFIIKSKFAYIGKRLVSRENTKSYYQIGYNISEKIGLPTMLFNFKTKPLIKNLVLLDYLLFIPYMIYLLFHLCKWIIIGTIWFVYYVFLKSYKHAWNDFGWSGNYLLFVIIFWQAISILLFIYFLRH